MKAASHEHIERLEILKGSRPTDGIYLEHYFRYRFATKYTAGRSVLDCACGTGYGTFLLAAAAKEVVGVDNSPEALAIANGHWARSNIRYSLLDARELSGLRQRFDAIVSFETIEHLEDPIDFIATVSTLLNPHGLLIVSTPERNSYRHEAAPNPHHLREFNGAEFERTLCRFFNDVEMFGQVLESRESRVEGKHPRWYSGAKAALIDAVIGNRWIYAAYLLRMRRRFSVVPAQAGEAFRYRIAVCRKR